jgi:hypothetical protein
MCEVENSFKDHERTKDMMTGLSSLYDNQFSDDYIAKVTPVLEEGGYKRIGCGHYIIEYCCHKDQRNVPKKDAKGKVIKPKKGWKPVKSLCPKELQEEVSRQLNWFLTKFKPYSNHMFNTLLGTPIGS